MLDLLLFILAEEDLPQEKILWLKKGGGGVCVRGGGTQQCWSKQKQVSKKLWWEIFFMQK